MAGTPFFSSKGGLGPSNSMVRCIRANIHKNLYAEVGGMYEMQVLALWDVTFTSFRGRLNKLGIGPSLPNQMAETADACLAQFKTKKI